MKKLKKISILLILLIIIFSNIVFASKNIPKEVEKVLDSYIDCLEDEDEDAFLYIDPENEELYEKTKQFLYEIGSFNYKIKKVEENNGKYTVEITIDAQGRTSNWSIRGITVEFNIKEINGEYLITNTTLFENIGMENVLKFIGKIFAIIGGIFLAFIVIFVIIIVVIIKQLTKKDKKVTKTNNINNDSDDDNF